MNEDQKITRVEITFEDGSSIYLVGEDAQKWKATADSQAVLCHVHGLEFPALNWQETKP